MIPARARYVNLVQALRLARELAGVPQWKMARELNVTHGRLADWERAARAPKAETLFRWADAVGVTL